MKSTFLMWAMFILAASGYERLQGPTELLFCDKDKAMPGYTLFGVGNRTWLLDLDGRVVHTWPVGTNPHLLENGRVVDASKDDPSGFQGFKEVDWDGKTVWEYSEKRQGYAPHHDWTRIFNKSITHEQAIAAGADPDKGPYRDGQMDAIVHTGKYVNPPEAGYRRESYDKDTHNQPRQVSNQIVWSYRSANSHGFFSHIGSSGQRLPNGNTFICSDTEGHFFEVTAKGELAWEYINPVTRDGPLKVLGDALPMTNSVFRAYRYAAGHPAFKDRDLTPKGTITERAAQEIDTYPKRRPQGDRPQGKGQGQGGRRGQGGGGNPDGRPPPGDRGGPENRAPQ